MKRKWWGLALLNLCIKLDNDKLPGVLNVHGKRRLETEGEICEGKSWII